MDLWSYIPLAVGCVSALLGMSQLRRQPSTGATRRRAWRWMGAAMILCGGASVYSIMKAVVSDGQIVLLLPAALIVALVVVVIVRLRPEIASASSDKPAAPSWTMRAVTLIIAALGVFFVGWIAANFAASFFPDDRDEARAAGTVVAAIVVGIAVLIAVPLFVIDGMTRARQRVSETRPPVSAEVADKIYQSGVDAAQAGYRISQATTRVIIFAGVGAFFCFLVGATLSHWVVGVGESGSAGALSGLSGVLATVAAVAGGILVVGALGFVLVGPSVWQAMARLRLSHLSVAERDAARQRRVSNAFPGARFPDALAGSLRTLRALTIAPSRLVSLEDVELGSLEDVDAIPLDEFVEAFQDGTASKLPSIDDMDDDEGVVIILLLARALKAAYGDGMRFDAFLDDEDDTVRILVAGDGDYDDFPAPLAHKIAQNI